MDIRVAEYYGLKVCRAVAGNCGKIGVPGSGVEHDYAGVVESSFELRVGDSVRFGLGGFQVIDHPFPLFLLGARCALWGLEGAKLELQWDFPHNRSGHRHCVQNC